MNMTLPIKFKVENIFLGQATCLQSQVGSKFPNLKIFGFYLKNLQQIKDSILGFLTQHLEQPVSVHM